MKTKSIFKMAVDPGWVPPPVSVILTHKGCRFGLQSGHVREATRAQMSGATNPCPCLPSTSLPLPILLPLSL